MKEYNKLVRDKIPDFIKKKDQPVEFHIASETEYRQKSIEKILEEAEEFSRSPTVEELADLQEALNNAVAAIGSTKVELEKSALGKLKNAVVLRSELSLTVLKNIGEFPDAFSCSYFTLSQVWDT